MTLTLIYQDFVEKKNVSYVFLQENFKIEIKKMKF